MIMFAFYTFLPSLNNYLLKFISLIVILGEVRKFLGEVLKISGEVQSHPRGGAHLLPKPGLGISTLLQSHCQTNTPCTPPHQFILCSFFQRFLGLKEENAKCAYWKHGG